MGDLNLSVNASSFMSQSRLSMTRGNLSHKSRLTGKFLACVASCEILTKVTTSTVCNVNFCDWLCFSRLETMEDLCQVGAAQPSE